MSRLIETSRLVLRPWESSDIGDVVSIYAAAPVARWLVPQLNATDEEVELRTTFEQWRAEDREPSGCVGHWAVQKRASDEVVGGLSLQYAPPGGESLTISWALAPGDWGHGFATEAGDALIRWAMHERGVLEVFAIVQPDNERAAATAERIGMEWVTELGHLSSGRYQVYRIRHEDLAYEDEHEEES
jgi:[ribosomal protein S5]-alanine N-acetyltransferase